MSYSKRKESNRKRLLKRRTRQMSKYAGVIVNAENRNEIIEEFGQSYYDMYNKQVEEETKQIEALGDEVPDDYERRFPILTEEKLQEASVAYGKGVVNRKNKELKAYLKGKSHYRWQGQTHPVMTQDYLMESERMADRQRKAEMLRREKQESDMKKQIADKAGINVEAEGVEFSVKKVEAVDIHKTEEE